MFFFEQNFVVFDYEKGTAASTTVGQYLDFPLQKISTHWDFFGNDACSSGSFEQVVDILAIVSKALPCSVYTDLDFISYVFKASSRIVENNLIVIFQLIYNVYYLIFIRLLRNFAKQGEVFDDADSLAFRGLWRADDAKVSVVKKSRLRVLRTRQ